MTPPETMANAKLFFVFITFILWSFRAWPILQMPLKIIPTTNNTILSRDRLTSLLVFVVFFLVHSSYCIKGTIISWHKKVFCCSEINGFKTTLQQPYLIYLVLTNCHSLFIRNFTEPNLYSVEFTTCHFIGCQIMRHFQFS